MSDHAGTLERFAVQLSGATEQAASLVSDDQVLDTLAQLGVQFPDTLLTEPAISAARQAILQSVAPLRTLTEALISAIEAEDTGPMISAGAAVITQCSRTILSFDRLVTALTNAGPTFPGITAAQVTELVDDLPRKLLDLLLVRLVELSPGVGAVFTIFGIVDRSFRPGVPADPTRPDYELVTLHLDRLLPAITDPVRHLGGLYQWGQPGFDATALLTALETALARLGLPVLLIPAAPGQPLTLQAYALDVKSATPGPGLDLALVLPASLETTFTVPVSPPTWTAEVRSRGSLEVGATASIRPPFTIAVTPTTGSLDAAMSATLRANPAEPFVLIGQAGGSRLEFGRLSIGGGAAFAVTAGGTVSVAPTAEGEIGGARLVIDASQGDGFVSTLLGGDRIEATFDVGFTFAADTGLRFHGSGALEIQVPLHLQVGPLEIQTLYLVAQLGGGSIPLELSAGFAAKLGPLAVAVDRLGVIVDLGFPPGGGNLGPARIGFAFKPPTGVGLSVDAGIVKGGGFLSIDTSRGEYAGALELTFAGFLSLKAVGIITTRMQDGSSGFSLLIIITAEFGTGLQLGFGFTLLGVGGLLGLNRTMRLDALAEGVRAGTLDRVLFPHDVVANAPQIISDLRAFFPPRNGTFLIGPMAKLGWGTPTLVSLTLGIVIEIPGNIAILGVLRVALPSDQAAVVVLQVNFIGSIEFDKSRTWFFASLFDSRVLFITISGEMGLLMAFGKNADFVLSVGGFHPRFSPPPLPFPSPRRIALDVLNTSVARIRAEGYFAVTTNTVQFGCVADAFFGFDALNVSGGFTMDALIRFSPFYFIISFSSHFDVKVFGIGVWGLRIRLEVEGPTPWRARGSAGISLLFFDIDVDIDVTWGDRRDTDLPPVDVLGRLVAELSKVESWRPTPPKSARILVSLRKLPEAEAQVALHPLGTLQISQRFAPLDAKLDRVGAQRPSDANRFALTASSPVYAKRADVTEQFAPAQFEDLSDDERLTRKPFEDRHGGVELSVADAQLESGAAVVRVARYDLITVDTNARRHRFRFHFLSVLLFSHFLKGSAVARSVLSARSRTLRIPVADGVQVKQESFTVALQATNRAFSPAATFASEGEAREWLATTVSADRRLAGTLHVLPHFEVVT